MPLRAKSNDSIPAAIELKNASSIIGQSDYGHYSHSSHSSHSSHRSHSSHYSGW
jgi:hypothetical protein